MAIIPTQNQYPDRAGYLGLDTDRNVLSVMSDGKMKSTSIPEGWVNVKDFGAKGDGVTDDTEAIQNAIDNTPRWGTVFIPAGEYKINTIYIKKSITLSGINEQYMSTTVFGNLVIVSPDVSEEDVFSTTKTDLPRISRITIKNIQFSNSLLDWLIFIQSASVIRIENCSLINASTGIITNHSWILNIKNSYFYHNNIAFKSNRELNNVNFYNCSFYEPRESALNLWACANLNLSYSIVENYDPSYIPVVIDGTGQNININNNYFEQVLLFNTKSYTRGLGIYNNHLFNNMTKSPTESIINLSDASNANISNNTFIGDSDTQSYVIKAANSLVTAINNYIENFQYLNLTDTYSQENFSSVNKLNAVSTANRPLNPIKGLAIFDTTLGKPIWYDGTNWIDSSGTTV